MRIGTAVTIAARPSYPSPQWPLAPIKSTPPRWLLGERRQHADGIDARSPPACSASSNKHDLEACHSEAVAEATQYANPAKLSCRRPCDAFRTATGVHAAAIVKAYKKGDHELANPFTVCPLAFPPRANNEIDPSSGPLERDLLAWRAQRPGQRRTRWTVFAAAKKPSAS